MAHQLPNAAFDSPTEPRRTEEQLRRDARRDAFRVKLADTLRALTDPMQIQEEAARMIGEHLRVSRAFYSEIETIEGKDNYIIQQDYHAQDIPSNSGRFHSHDFGEFIISELSKGNPVSVSNIATDERFSVEQRQAYTSIGVHAWVAAPLIKGGSLVGVFGVSHVATRDWTPDEISLIWDTAERAWTVVERARSEAALRESEARHRMLFDSIDEGVCIFERIPFRADGLRDYRYIAMNPAMQAMFGIPDLSGQSLRDHFPNESEDWYDDYDRVLATGQPIRFERESVPQGLVLEMFVTRQEDGTGQRLLAVMQDITERKRSEQRQELLLKLSDALSSLDDPTDVEAAITRESLSYFSVDRCFYCAIEEDQAIIRQDAYRGNLPSVSGIYPLASFPILKAVIDAGQPFIVYDVHTTDLVDEPLRQICLEVQVISFIDVPVVKQGKIVGVFCLVQSEPRNWTSLEVNLAIEIAERTWAATERAHTEEKLLKSEEKYRTLFNSIDEGFCLAEVIFDEDNKPVDLLVLEVNQAWERQTGLGNVAGKRMSSVASSAIAEQWINLFGRVALTGKSERLEGYSPVLKRWYNLFAARAISEGNHTVALVFDDVTERKKNQEQIERTNQKLNEILSSIQDDFYVINRDWVFIYANKLFTSKLEKEPEDFIGHNLWELFPRHLGTALEENFRAAMEKREVRRFEIPGRYTNAWYRMTVFPSTEGITVIGTEITERKMAEEALRQSDARYRMLNETLRDALVQVNMEGYIVSCNDIFCQLVGYSHEELSALTYRDLTPERWHAFEAEIVRNQILPRGFSDIYEKEYQCKDGKIIPVELRTVLMRDPSGQPSMMWAIVRDITERKQVEETVRENERQLQLLNESLEQKVDEKTAELRRLASDLTKAEQRERNRISHILHDDLQQRIYSIQMQLKVLKDEIPQDSESAQKEVTDLEKQVKEILTVARHLSIDLNPPILRGEGLSHAVNWLAAQMKQRYGLSVEVQADEALTIPDEELHILLFNCIRELLFNVVKHAQASKAIVTIQKSNAMLRVEVCDNGRGFDVHSTERQNREEDSLQVTFGLSTLRHQLSLYDGSVEIQSVPGTGTQIILTIPVREHE